MIKLRSIFSTQFFFCLMILLGLSQINSSLCFAHKPVIGNVILHGNQLIATPITYQHVTLDLTDARFTVNQGGSLNIEHSIINVIVSAGNPFFVKLNSGKLTLNDNVVNVKVSAIKPNANLKASFQLMTIQDGVVRVTNNSFNIDTPFAVQLLETKTAIKNGIVILNNALNYFHGGLYLIHSNHASVKDNTFSNVSFSNIYNDGNGNIYERNLFYFPGNLKLGNAFDIVNSENIRLSNNIIVSASNYGIAIKGGNNIFIDNNKIMDGQSFAIIIQTPLLLSTNNKMLFKIIFAKKNKFIPNNNIVITNNYLAQNKYGITSGLVKQLIVMNNIFIQRFSHQSMRRYATDNAHLLPFVSDLIWRDNQYKEAFAQDIAGDNSASLKFVTFPSRGGVTL